jgi:hypothetical protein
MLISLRYTTVHSEGSDHRARLLHLGDYEHHLTRNHLAPDHLVAQCVYAVCPRNLLRTFRVDSVVHDNDTDKTKCELRESNPALLVSRYAPQCSNHVENVVALRVFDLGTERVVVLALESFLDLPKTAKPLILLLWCA